MALAISVLPFPSENFIAARLLSVNANANHPITGLHANYVKKASLSNMGIKSLLQGEDHMEMIMKKEEITSFFK